MTCWELCFFSLSQSRLIPLSCPYAKCEATASSRLTTTLHAKSVKTTNLWCIKWQIVVFTICFVRLNKCVSEIGSGRQILLDRVRLVISSFYAKLRSQLHIYGTVIRWYRSSHLTLCKKRIKLYFWKCQTFPWRN